MSGREAEAGPRYIGVGYLAELRDRLSERDWAVLGSVARVRVLSGGQAERLHFADLSERTRARTRRAVLARLARLRVLATLERRIGGVRGGSAGLVFTVDTAGRRLLDQRAAETTGRPHRARRPGTPGQLFARHALAVSELFVMINEQARRDGFEVARFDAEPACWWPSGRGDLLKPDCYAVLRGEGVIDYWWCEVDLGTESLPTVKRKLSSYLDFAQRQQRGPDGLLPRVLVTAATAARLEMLRQLATRLPQPADRLFHFASHGNAAAYLARMLRE